MTSVRRQAPAKLNLGLRVGAKRSDGYHRIRTVFQTVTLFDSITVEPAEGDDDRLSIHGPVDLEPDPDNLVCRAVRFVRDRIVDLPPLRLHLDKTVPTGAGLGGGSSDAAAVIRALLESTNRNPLADVEPELLAHELGADVPFFLRGGTVQARGIGEQLTPLKDLEAFVLIGVPPFEVSTPWAFGELDEMSDVDSVMSPEASSTGVKAWKSLDLTNDFRTLLEHHFPLYESLFSSLSQFTDYTSITGSGCALYGLWDQPEDRDRAAEGMRNRHPDCTWYPARFLTSTQLQSHYQETGTEDPNPTSWG